MNFLDKERTTQSSICAWKLQWTEEAGGLQSMGSPRVGHDRATEHAHRDLYVTQKMLS